MKAAIAVDGSAVSANGGGCAIRIGVGHSFERVGQESKGPETGIIEPKELGPWVAGPVLVGASN